LAKVISSSKDTLIADIQNSKAQHVFFDAIKPPLNLILSIQKAYPSVFIIYNGVCCTPAILFDKGIDKKNMLGINALPGFLKNDLSEVFLLSDSAKDFLNFLNWNYQEVAERVGMVAPRIIFMIINEAFYTVQEGTASKEDIDIGMKLGTNYPYGPFEWAEIIGLKNIYTVLKSIYKDTKEGRYKICPLLKTTVLLSK